MRKICFVHCENIEVAETQMFGIHYMPGWIYTLTSHLKDQKELEFTMFDNRIQKGLPPKADIYLFSGLNQHKMDIIELKEKTQEQNPNSIFLLGGPICWSFDMAEKVNELTTFDHIVIGDGENIINELINKIIAKEEIPQIIRNKQKFNLELARPLDKELLDSTLFNYYGAVIEVSRGCPFLCEFCDIRVQLDNNRAHIKKASLIVEELNYFAQKGIKQILFSCDNFIGNPVWAQEVCDEIIAWKERTSLSINIYTWLTINVANHPKLLESLQAAGFDMLFIGIESFGSNQLLETAKIQNVKTTLIDSIKIIQSYGFIVVAGLIFGFDSDPDDVSEQTLQGIKESGLITGDPSLLTALPGTPLYKRMKFSKRLRDGKMGLGGSKLYTNIRYLRSKDKLVHDFLSFFEEFNKGKYQYERLLKYYENLNPQVHNKTQKSNYTNPFAYLKLLFKNKKAIIPFLTRFYLLFRAPSRLFYFLKAAFYTLFNNTKEKPLWKYFQLWTFIWANSLLKYHNVTGKDFDIDSVADDFDKKNLVPDEYMNEMDEPIPLAKMKAQRKLTLNALKKIN